MKLTEQLRSYGFTDREVVTILRHGWIRHRDSARFEASMLAASQAGWMVTPPNWPNARDRESGWYIYGGAGSGGGVSVGAYGREGLAGGAGDRQSA